MAKKVFPWSLNAEIPSDGSRLRIGWVSITQHRPDDVHNIEAFPDRGHDRAAGHVLAQDGVEMPGRELLVMLLHELLSRKDKLREHSLKPLCSNLFKISPTMPRWTPSGLIMTKVRSLLASVDSFAAQSTFGVSRGIYRNQSVQKFFAYVAKYIYGVNFLCRLAHIFTIPIISFHAKFNHLHLTIFHRNN